MTVAVEKPEPAQHVADPAPEVKGVRRKASLR